MQCGFVISEWEPALLQAIKERNKIFFRNYVTLLEMQGEGKHLDLLMNVPLRGHC